MAIIRQNLENGMTLVYSNIGMKIHGGFPEADYDFVYDPTDIVREYTETSTPITSTPTGMRSLSKRKLYHALKDLGIWDQVKVWMETEGYWEDWEYSTTLEIENQLVKTAITVLKEQFGLSDDTINDIIESSVVL